MKVIFKRYLHFSLINIYQYIIEVPTTVFDYFQNEINRRKEDVITNEQKREQELREKQCTLKSLQDKLYIDKEEAKKAEDDLRKATDRYSGAKRLLRQVN